MVLSNRRIAKALIRLRRCAGWSAPFVVRKLPKTGFLASRPITDIQFLLGISPPRLESGTQRDQTEN